MKTLWEAIQLAVAVLILAVVAFALVCVGYWAFTVNHPGAPWWGFFLHD